MSQDKGEIIILLLSVICGLLLGGALTSIVYKAEAIERGHAHYDTVTGNWEWNK